MRKFRKGQKVYWNDPAGETSGVYTIYSDVEKDYADWTDEDIEDGDERIISIYNEAGSEAEVYACELDYIF